MDKRYQHQDVSQQWQNWENQAAGQSWDEPGAAVWDRIETELPTRSRRRRWLWLGLLLLTGLCCWHLFTVKKNSGLPQVEDPVLVWDQGSGVRQEGSGVRLQESGVSLQDSGLRGQGSDVGMQEAEVRGQGSRVHTTVTAKTPIRTSATAQPPVFIADNQRSLAVGPVQEIKNRYQEAPAQLDKLGFLPTPLLPLSHREEVLAELKGKMQPLLLPEQEKPAAHSSTSASQTSGFFVTTSYHYLKPYAQVTNLHPTPPLRAREQSVNSNEWGLQIGYRIAENWSVRTGLSRYRIDIRQQQAFRRNFDPTLEQPTADGSFKSSYAVSINGKYGQTDMELDFIRAANEQIADGTPLILIVNTRQQLHMLHLPLLLEYQHRQGNWRWSLQTGPSVSILQGQQQQVSATPRALRANPLRVRNLVERTDLSKTSLDWQMAAELGYAFSPQGSVYIQPQYRFGIQDVTATDTQRTRVHSLGVGMGLRWDF